MITGDEMKRVFKIIKLLDRWKAFFLLAVGGLISEFVVIQFITYSRMLTLDAIIEANSNMFFKGIVLFILSSVVSMFCVMFFDYSALKIPRKMIYDLKKTIIDIFLSNPRKALKSIKQENVIIRLEKDIEIIGDYYEPVFLSVSTLGRTLGALIIGFQVSWILTLIITILGFLNFFIIQKRADALYEVRNDLGEVEESLFQKLIEFVKNQFMIRIMGNPIYVQRMRSDINRLFKENKKRIGRINAVSSSINGAMQIFTTIMVLAVGAFLVSGENLSTGGLVAMVTLQSTLMDPYRYFEMIIDATADVFSAHKRIDELITEFGKEAQTPDETEIPKLTDNYSLTIENVFFGYENQPELLNGFSLSLHDHEIKYLWGRSGIGKTTVLKLILGAEKPHSGDICINEANHKSPVSRKFINYVSSQPICFNGSIYENIAMSSDIDYEKVKICAEQAGLDEEIARLDKGYDTVIQDNGNNLSGGQKARLAIARAFYRNKRIYLIDEIFASLDDKTANHIMGTIQKKVSEGSAALIITHRKEIIPEEGIIYNL